MASAVSFLGHKNVSRPIKTYTRPTKLKDESTSFLGGELPVEYEGACRLCLELSGNMTKIFNESESIVPIKIRSILTIEVDEDDQLPSLICETCLCLLNETYSFKKRSIANDVKLRQYLRKSTAAVSKPSLFEDSSSVKSDDDDNLFSVEVEREDCTVEWDDQNPLAGVIESFQPEQTPNTTTLEEPVVEHPSPPETSTLTTLQTLEINNSDGEFVLPDHNYDKGQETNTPERVVEAQEKRLGPYERVELLSSEEEFSGEDGDDREEDKDENIPLVERLLQEKTKKEPYFTCVKCKRHYETKIELNTHRKTCILKEICVMCPKSFVSRSLLLRHMRTHTGEKPFECEFCSGTFSQKEILLRHIAQIHATVRPYKCKLCGKCFAIPSLLAGHIRASHDSSRKYTCHLCGKEFNHCSGLSRHRATHQDVYYCCKICQRRFTDVSSVKRHVKLCHWEVLAKQGFSKPTGSNNSVPESEIQSQNEFTLTLIEKRADMTEDDMDEPVDDPGNSCMPNNSQRIKAISQVLNGESVKDSAPVMEGGANEAILSNPLNSTSPKRSRGRPRKFPVELSTLETSKSNMYSNQRGSLGKEQDETDSLVQTPVTQKLQKKRRASSVHPAGTNIQEEKDPLQDENSVLNKKLENSELLGKESPPVLKKPRGRPRKSLPEAIRPTTKSTNSFDLTSSEPNVTAIDSSEQEVASQPIDEMKNCEQPGRESTPVLKKPRGRPRKSSLQAISPTNSSENVNSEGSKNSSMESVGHQVAPEVDNKTNSGSVILVNPTEKNAQEAKDVQDSSANETLGNSELLEKQLLLVSKRPRGRPRKSLLETVKPALKVGDSSDVRTKGSSVGSLQPKISSHVTNETNSGTVKNVESSIPYEQEYEELLAESEDVTMAIVKTIDTLQTSLKSEALSIRKSDKSHEQQNTDSVSQEKDLSP